VTLLATLSRFSGIKSEFAEVESFTQSEAFAKLPISDRHQIINLIWYVGMVQAKINQAIPLIEEIQDAT